MNVPCLQPNFRKRDGLVTVIAQDFRTHQVLMVAWANETAFRETLQTGLAHYWSTTRRELWRKGAESGNVQRVVRVLVDCDGDALVYVVQPTGPACHSGHASCFFRDVLGDVSSVEVMSPVDPDRLPAVELDVNEALLPAKGEWYGQTAEVRRA